MNNIVGAFEAKTHFARLLKKVEQGEEVIITRHGHPIARIVPTTGNHQGLIDSSIEQLKTFGERHTLGDLDWRQLKNEGRK